MGLFTQLEIRMGLMSGDNIVPLYPGIVSAFDSVSKNLREKYNVQIITNFSLLLSDDPHKEQEAVFFTMFVPEEIAKSGFNVGRHMVGVSRHIRTHYHDLYCKYMNGTGLFTYEVYKVRPSIEIVHCC